ncbi:DNA polymerase delta subunit 2-like [Prorops nasuta]|uniref:DNA polymerase delta subunit 2-like n=1 Tax=Prorops nasuta TaxID=863751 RepID=UPI0034CF1B64
MEEHMYYRKHVLLEDYQRFNIHEKNIKTFFSSIYLARLGALKKQLSEKAKQKWNYSILSLSNLVDAVEDNLYIIIGVLYKHQELKPSILKDLSEELQVQLQPARSHYASTKDLLFLEDETFRVKLIDNYQKVQEVVTGLVCATLGQVIEDGSFLVKDWCFPGCILNPSTSNIITYEKESSIILISGIDLASNPKSVSLNLFLEWVTGMIGSSETQQKGALITHIIIAGNSVKGTVETYTYKGYTEMKQSNLHQMKETARSMYRLDKILKSLVQCSNIILMPGEFDPSDCMLPQQPLHPCILPETTKYQTYHGATNPWIGKIGSRIIAGSSGQPIDDIMKVAGLLDFSSLEWLEQTLIWQHFAPTAPDTLPAYAYFKTDPFIMTECPDIYFAGNMKSYDTKLYTAESGQKVRLICVPKFSKTQTAVLVNLQNLQVQPISFGIE